MLASAGRNYRGSNFAARLMGREGPPNQNKAIRALLLQLEKMKEDPTAALFFSPEVDL